MFWDNSFLTKNRTLFDAHFNRFQCWFKYQPNVLFLSFYRQKRHKSREKKRKNLQTIVSVTYMEWKSPQILLCLIGKCLKAHFILLGEGGGYIYSIWSKSLHLILKIDQIEGADWVLNLVIIRVTCLLNHLYAWPVHTYLVYVCCMSY